MGCRKGETHLQVCMCVCVCVGGVIVVEEEGLGVMIPNQQVPWGAALQFWPHLHHHTCQDLSPP